MDKAQARERIGKLRKLIDRYRYEYHVLDRLSIPEGALDALKKELFDLEDKYPDLVTPDSPTQRVAGEPMKGFTKVTHPGRMISLNDVFNEEDLRDWHRRLQDALGRKYEGGYYCDLKMDGLAIELRYENGRLVQASTRGDGLTGDDVTQNIRTVDAVPLILRDDDRKAPATLILRGEVFFAKSEFARINKKVVSEGEEPYPNPRNLAAGMVRKKDFAVSSDIRLSFYAYGIVGTDGTYGDGFASHDEEYTALREWGIPTNPHGKVVKSLEAVPEFHSEWEKKRDLPDGKAGALDYEFDGVVISVNEVAAYRRAGVVGKAPRGAAAFKFSPRQSETIVEDIQIQVGRTGTMTPVAHLKPVLIGGTTVTRATLHNMDEIGRLGLKIGDTVVVGRAGDVIPDILKVLPELRTGREKEFRMPKKCPVCGAAIKREEGKVASFCPNPECPAKKREAIYHFASRTAADIDGLGPQTIDQLMDSGLVQDASDLYTLTATDLLNLEGFADVSSAKLVEAIAARRTMTLQRFLYGLGIEHVGEESSRSLAQHFHTLANVQKATVEELTAVNDVGPIVARSIATWFAQPYSKNLLKKFSKAGVVVSAEKAPAKGKLTGKTFVVSGTLDAFSREEAEEKIRAHGGHASASVSKDTDYLVVGAEPGDAKTKAAKKHGTQILDEAAFLKLLR